MIKYIQNIKKKIKNLLLKYSYFLNLITLNKKKIDTRLKAKSLKNGPVTRSIGIDKNK